MAVPRLRPAQLGDYQSRLLAQGGQGKVYGLAKSPPGLSGDFVYKEYKPSVDPDRAALEALAAFPGTLAAGEGVFLADRSAWPDALVEDGGRVTGFLMRRVADDYWIDIGGDRYAQGMQYLLNDPPYLAKIGLSIDDRQRLLLLKDLAAVVALLHTAQVAVGDLSPKNVLFTLGGGRPRCLLIDCDSMRVGGRSVVEQVETPGWEVPEADKATAASDTYKLGLIAVRLFNGDQFLQDDTALEAVSPELAALARASMWPAPGDRPPVNAWLGAVDRALIELPTRQTARQATLNQQASAQAAFAQQAAAVAPSPFSPAQPVRTGPGTGGRWGGLAWAVGVVVAALLVFAGVKAGSGPDDADVSTRSGLTGGVSDSSVSGGDAGGSTAPTAPTDTTGLPTTEPTPTGSVVSVDTGGVDGQAEAAAVAQMFGRFYGAINIHDYDTALTFYDPASKAVDQSSKKSKDDWKGVMSTTQDTDVVLDAISHSGRYTLATVSFQSTQDPGYGPATDTDETCTRWQNTYWLTHTGGHYRIFKAPSKGVSHQPC